MKQYALLVLVLLVAGCGQAPDYLETVSEFQRHKNEGNLDLVMELFAEDASLHFGSLGSIAGLDAIRDIHEYDVALNTHLRFEQCELAGQEVTCRVIETNDWLKAVAVESITYDESTFTFAPDGRITAVVSALSAESDQLLGEVLVEFDVWARANQPVEYAELFADDGAFEYSSANGEKVLALLRQWRGE